ncbi:hypothetical protein RchiOBHm_Chr1g0324731 [Rosa chinensis]|uniref:Uncharacterized protein n=1 Tax=Rosa chinensis TaxID=74649 RepID=A0A2P6S9V7_ROSCH|nr:hypothetical protein RchiOBHm_Chr1g0324731 [Rosa chinensis]
MHMVQMPSGSLPFTDCDESRQIKVSLLISSSLEVELPLSTLLPIFIPQIILSI